MDLNLLKLLDALLNERSVTRAGARLGLSQPAASRALGRLRQQFGDPLLIRGPHGLEPTPRALALKDAVAQLLEDARALVEPREFDPHLAQGSVRIASVDHLARLLMPRLLGRLEQQAPRLLVEMPPTHGDNV
ncbi:MAG: HTH-type transcriptional regulator LeuO [Stenotrophomonas maltophilia]|nr:MAG: HTH-type transcriptional regulator LeuO [Stenotrophomonas maltophilia]